MTFTIQIDQIETIDIGNVLWVKSQLLWRLADHFTPCPVFACDRCKSISTGILKRMLHIYAAFDQHAPRKIATRIIPERPDIGCLQAEFGGKNRRIRCMTAKIHLLISRIKINDIVSNRNDFHRSLPLSIKRGNCSLRSNCCHANSCFLLTRSSLPQQELGVASSLSCFPECMIITKPISVRK
ncbi:hypothetical protein Lpp226_0425 [Lacticaseibacillus paracasei subsp. paracasei Lpp226]|nr:hypothetical protein Lpp226_0425 [Lacticaseibacillus paracasei subsp. paracasei Lpp226]